MSGEIPSTEVAATPLSYAFRDLNPVASTHVLVVPRGHIDHAGTVQPGDAEVVADMIGLAQEIARAEGIDGSGYRLVFNVGDDAGNTVGHLHMHVLGGRPMAWPPG